jgi:methylated-DNA-[protein]-cysteine S-methyltransferase
MFQIIVDSPIGRLRLEANAQAVTGVHFVAPDDPPIKEQSNRILAKARAQLRQYFAGRRKSFDLPLDWNGMSEFQRAVLTLVHAVDYGQTTTYAEIARKLRRVTSARAVGRANARNPISIFIPCHRVIGSDGKLTGYGGGLPAKERLLQHEGAVLV